MPRLRDYASDMRRYYLPKTATRVRDGWHNAVGKRVQGARQQARNTRNRKARERGRRDLPARAGDQIRSRTPVVRNRINRGTGRPHRDDRNMGRRSDQALARHRQQQQRARTR